ncbi:MAG: NADH-quinone oxidoreductase subunit H [Candidatus Nitrosocosmicus sp.]|nr:NADH-quinone oxidoreductase subunit H [Candidatus Nitrosocosmicus sp.]
MPIETSASVSDILIGFIQFMIIIILAPLLTGIMRKIKAITQKRIGSSIFQTYFDILKLMKKNEVISQEVSWIFRFSPWIIFSSTLVVAFFIPIFVVYSPFGLGGDIILVIGLFGLSRFFLMLAGLDVSSAFGGIGVSREMMISSLIEPALFLALFTVAVTYGSTNVEIIMSHTAESSILISASLLFSLFGFFIIVMAETGKIPFDNPATHLELTMVHEAMVLEFSGKSLALIELSQSIKQLLLMSLLINFFIPWGLSTSFSISEMIVGLLVFLLKMVSLGILIAYIETKVAKWRLFRIPDLIFLSLASGLMGIIFLFI